MTRALSKSRTVPRRGLSREEAAEYLGISEAELDDHVAAARVARPRIIDEDTRVWDIHELKIYRSGTAFDVADVYVVGFDEYVKIGFSRNASERIRGIQDGLPVELTVYKIFENGSRSDEQRYHRQFAEYRTRGEWYVMEGHLAAWIKRIQEEQ